MKLLMLCPQWGSTKINKCQEFLTITTEFEPPPDMWTNLEDNSLIVSQWEVNCYMKDLLKEKLI